MERFLIKILLILTVAIGTFGQSPQVNCLSVASNGNVTVNWTPSTNLASVFVQYNIYSNASGSFVQEGTVNNVNTSLFIHSGAGANTGSVDYFVTLVYNNGVSNIELPPLDTLSTIFLVVNNPSDGTAILQWSDLSAPMSANNGSYYYIQKQIVPGGWSLIDSVLISDANYYRDTVTVCSADINYQVYLNNSEGCQSTSNIDGDLFQDLIPPDAPILSSVTVDTTSGNASLTWYPSNAQDASAYIIVQNIGGVWVIIDTVFGHDNTTYNNTNSNADLLSEQYGIAAFDSCWNGNPPAPNTSSLGTPQKSLFLKSSYKVCATEVTIKWNNYINWSSGVDKYNIYRSDEGASYQLVSSNNSGDTVYSEILNYGVTYCYIIEAISSNHLDTAISNVVCRYTNQPPSPKFAYLQNVTVESNEVNVKLHPDQTGITKEIELFRSEDGISFESIFLTTSITDPIVYIDDQVDPNSDNFWYRYVVRDSCENEILTSNQSRNINLQVSTDQNSGVNFLQWNSYDNWNGNLLKYEIYRSVNGEFSSTPITVTNPNTLYFEDDISDLIGTDANGNFCYYIQAIESNNVYGIQEEAKSNEACITQSSLVYIPNAMVIGGSNSHWQPIVNLIDFTSYSCKIYNRLGQVIFSSTNSNENWNGIYKSSYVELGVYIYQVNFNDGSGKNFDFWGTITVLK
ncbi:MAG: gliding motility-associated C-terminal domain-containing protein [Flavobacteriales bacterium]|nr:gliding motility-associated C-terminal domain-containing protein [Flavobacteriales bacterium]MCB9198480.1 gliding motility-associated C-terminal domain-containing protein [Flavobacteriales bacterium]